MGRIAGVVAFDGAPTGSSIESMLVSSGAGATTFGREGNVRIAIDGMIYNRDQLGGGSDASLVATLYERHGFAEMLTRLNGDFAIAIHDGQTDTLWLGRDRFGIKPLYYQVQGERIAFASRPRPLLGLRGVSVTPNRRFVACFAGSHYRTFDNEPTESPYLDIAQLPAGRYLRARGRDITMGTWWTLAEEPELSGSEEELAEQYLALLRDAVAVRLRRSSRPAFTLSGGMDSSSVLACAVASAGRKQQAYSTVYDDATYDESPEIRNIIGDCVEKWHPVRIGNPDLAALVPRMIAVNDEPVATATWLSHFLLCEQAASDGVGTLFGGLGGDELNAGEYEYFYFFFADLKATGQDALLERETAKWIEHHDHPIFKKSHAAMRGGLERLVDLSRRGVCLADATRLARYRDVVRPEYFDLAGFTPVMDHPFSSYLKNRTHQDIFRETAPCCLRAADRQSAAFGMDVSWPFFDHRLVELMFRVPGTQKIRSGVTKHLLRQATRGVLPEETRTRIKKTGWNAPAHLWFSGTGRELLLDLIGSRAFIERGIYDVVRVRELIEEHQEIVLSRRPVDNHMMFLWQLLNLELWLRSLGS